jgi:hypothetical protein
MERIVRKNGGFGVSLKTASFDNFILILTAVCLVSFLWRGYELYVVTFQFLAVGKVIQFLAVGKGRGGRQARCVREVRTARCVCLFVCLGAVRLNKTRLTSGLPLQNSAGQRLRMSGISYRVWTETDLNYI